MRLPCLVNATGQTAAHTPPAVAGKDVSARGGDTAAIHHSAQKVVAGTYKAPLGQKTDKALEFYAMSSANSEGEAVPQTAAQLVDAGRARASADRGSHRVRPEQMTIHEIPEVQVVERILRACASDGLAVGGSAADRAF